MANPQYITGYTTEKIDRNTKLQFHKINMRDTKPSGILLSFSIKEKNEKNEKPFNCKYIDYKDFIEQKYGNFTDHVLMMENGYDFGKLLANVYNDDISYLNSNLKKQFGGLGNKDEEDEEWDRGSFVIWNYDCIVNKVQENVRGGKSQGNLHTILQGQQQNQEQKILNK